MPPMLYDAVIFDLDGTLLDSLDDIMAAGNHALATVGRPPRTREEGKSLAGQGLPYFVEHALGPEHQEHFDQALAAHQAYYAEHIGERSKPFPGIADTLTAAENAGLRMAVLSNKLHFAALQDIENFFGDHTFEIVFGHREGYPVKPDPTSAHEIRELLGVSADRIAYVGDTAADIQTAVAAGFDPIGVTWGFRDEAELRDTGATTIADTPEQLTAALLRTSR